MNRALLVGRILEDEGIRGDLTDDAAQILVEWLVHQAEAVIGKSKSESAARKEIDALCLGGRAIAQLVGTAKNDSVSASALAKAERLPWPLPGEETNDEVTLMRRVLEAKSQH
jgi:hypothetical protein